MTSVISYSISDQIVDLERFVNEGWHKRTNRVLQFILGKPTKTDSADGRKAQLGYGRSRFLAAVIKLFLKALEAHKAGHSPFLEGGFILITRRQLRKLANLPSDASVSEYLRRNNLGDIFERARDKARKGSKWVSENYRIRFRVDLFFGLISKPVGDVLEPTLFPKEGNVEEDVAGIVVAPVSSTPVVDTSLGKKEKDILADAPSFMDRKKIQTYEDMSPEAKGVFDQLNDYRQENIKDIPAKTFALIQRRVNDIAPKRQMTKENVANVLEYLGTCSDIFETRQLTNDLEHMVRYWDGYLMAINRHEAVCRNDNGPIVQMAQKTFGLIRGIYTDMDPTMIPRYLATAIKGEEGCLHLLGFALARGLKSAAVQAIARRASDFLRQRPVTYWGTVKFLKNLPTLIGIDQAEHAKLMAAAELVIGRASADERITDYYG